MELYFRRDIEKDLKKWLDSGDTILELSGARQVGKTTLLKHFGKENFINTVYISFAEDTGRRFRTVIDECQNGNTPNTFYTDIFEKYADLYGISFTNDADTLVIIDEIQESKEVYEMLKPFHDHLKCKMIATGSYLYKAAQYFQPVGCVSRLTLYPLSYLEFIQIFNRRKELEEAFHDSEVSVYDDWYANAYDLYTVLGGYPYVVAHYVNGNRDVSSIREKQKEIINVVIDELGSRMDNFADNLLIQDIIGSIVNYMLREKRGGKLISGFTKEVILNTESLSFNKKEIKNCISILASVGLISFCDKYDFDHDSISMNERIYFNDLGVLSFYLAQGNYDESQKKGIIAENFVFKTLNEPSSYHSIKGIRPQFGITNNGELDFTVISAMDDMRYGIEVKSGTNSAVTGKKLLESEKISYLVTFKGITNENTVENKITLPVWLSPLFRYNVADTVANDVLEDLNSYPY